MLTSLVIFVTNIFCQTILAAPQIVLNSNPNQVVINSPFSVSFSVTNSDAGSSFYYKAFGGIGDTTSDIHTLNGGTELNYNDSWTSFPQLTIGDSGQSDGSVAAKVIGSSGSYNFKIRLYNGSTGYTSPAISFIAVDPSPTPTPTLTNTPTPTNTPTITPIPSSTNTPAPTSTPSNTLTPTNTSYPTSTLLPTASIKPTVTPLVVEATPTDLPPLGTSNDPAPTQPVNVLGSAALISDTESVSSPASKFSLSDYLPAILIIVGGLLLVAPLIISKIKNKKPL